MKAPIKTQKEAIKQIMIENKCSKEDAKELLDFKKSLKTKSAEELAALVLF